MKKISTFIFAVVLVIALTACNGGKKAAAPTEEPVKIEVVEEVVAPEPAAPALSPAEMLKNFQAYAKEYGEAFNNISRNPRKYTELSSQSQKKVAEMEQIKSQLNARQLQDYQKALDIIVNVNKGGR